MQNRFAVAILFMVSVVCLSAALSRNAHAAVQVDSDGWKACPRCQTNTTRAEQWEANGIDERTDYNRQDLSGVWGYNGVERAFTNNAPLFTPYGQELHEQTLGVMPANGRLLYTQGSEKDYSLLNCNPLGNPRLFTYNYGFEFVMLPDRVLQFFELGHTWRTIWTDGRRLPDVAAVPNWLGWNIGHWEGDTFVIESTGFDERSWIERTQSVDGMPGGGYPHSENMRVVERYTRATYGTLEANVTITDPAVYTAPWVTDTATIELVPGTELWEYFCVPTESDAFNRDFTESD
jgi:hypothetical protein